jgi:hypothetical protein
MRSMAGNPFQAVVVHGLIDARSVLSVGRPVTLLSAQGAVMYAGSAWWRALIDRSAAEYPDVPFDNILDCADASGLALGALRIGQRRIILHPAAPGRAEVAAAAATLGCEVLTHRPPALDMAQHGALRRLHSWLHARTTLGDSVNGLS